MFSILVYLDFVMNEICFRGGIFSFKYLSEISVDENLMNSVVIKMVIERSLDLIFLVYEGGFKIWECSVDLVEYLLESGISF